MNGERCSHPGCTRTVKLRRGGARGLCTVHYKQHRAASQPPCSVAGCGRPVACGGLCALHDHRKRDGVDLDLPVRGSMNATLTALTEAALAYAEADTNEEFHAAQERLVRAAEAYQGIRRTRAGGVRRKRRVRPAAIGSEVVRGDGATTNGAPAGAQEAA